MEVGHTTMELVGSIWMGWACMGAMTSVIAMVG